MKRAEYMEQNPAATEAERTALHRAYYAQFVSPLTIATVVRHIGAAKLRASTNEHYNDIPLKNWDALVGMLPFAIRFDSVGDYTTLAGTVCVAKEAARQWLEAQEASK